MQKTLPLLRKTITLESALADDDNVLQEISYPERRVDFFVHLLSHSSDIEAVVAHHLGSKPDSCRIGEVKEWMAGSFNVCVPVYVGDKRAGPRVRRVLIRFPLPYKVRESEHAGNADEKLRCEAATFLWIREHCPHVPIPDLWGFGFSRGQSFTVLENAPFHARLMWYLCRTASSWLGYPASCRYVRHRCPRMLGSGYLIMDYIEEGQGQMLSESWEELRHDRDRRNNLFRGLSRIILSLARSSPFPRIGSLTIGDDGVVSLTNRPLTLRLQQLENDGIATDIDRDVTYATSDAYMMDLLACHDARLRHGPNSIRDEFDGQAQLAALTTMRALLPQYSVRHLRRGPFVLALTDLHQGNIFVDGDWNVKCLVDLEWTCTRPAEMLHPPYWLSGRRVDELDSGEHLEAFDEMHAEFMDRFEEEEALLAQTEGGVIPHKDQQHHHHYPLSHIMREGWLTGRFWYFHALGSPKGLYNIFFDHIRPRFADLDDPGLAAFERTLAPYWCEGAREFIAAKERDRTVYEARLRDAFAAGVTEGDDEEAANDNISK
ncbi:MAG: hypothetical protein M1825_004522 [Sarcosagium campestre]|nr:MAG: hypothetical protein M1825_004522 [Sarcosagium campestre]